MRGFGWNARIALIFCAALALVSGLAVAQEFESDPVGVETERAPVLPVAGDPLAEAPLADDPCDPVTLRSWLYYYFGIRSQFSGSDTAACRIGGHQRRDRIERETSSDRSRLDRSRSDRPGETFAPVPKGTRPI